MAPDPLEIATAPLRGANKAAQLLGRAISGSRNLEDAVSGKKVLITGSSSGIGRATAIRVARAGGIPLLVARRESELIEVRDEIRDGGGEAFVHPADLSDFEAIDGLVAELLSEHERVDVLVNNAGRSIRRSIELSLDRFHDFERTMELNYLAAIRLTMGFIPHWKEDRRGGHVVNVSTMGTQTTTPRFSAYLASKAALDMWSRVAGTELARHRISFTIVHMPLVRTEMIAPTRLYDSMPAMSTDQAAAMVCKGIRDRPLRVAQPVGTWIDVTSRIWPAPHNEAMKRLYKAFPDSAAARGDQPPPEIKASPIERQIGRIVRTLAQR